MNKKIILLFIFSYLIFFILIPPLNGPDEPEHYENIYWVAQGIYPYNYKKGQKPKYFIDDLLKIFLKKPLNFQEIKNSFLHQKKAYDKNEQRRFSLITFQSYHPPLYYIILSPSMWLANFLGIDLISRYYLTRLFSSLFYFGMIYFFYKILKLIFKNYLVIETILTFFAINPVVIKTFIGLNPDQGMAFFATVLLFLIIKINQKKFIKWQEIAYFSVLSSAAALAKFSGIFSIIFSEIFLFLKSKTKKFFFIYSLFYLIIFALIFYPWVYLNFKRYGWMSTEAFFIAETRPLRPLTFFPALGQAFFEFRHTIMHYAGFLGSSNQIYPPKIFFVSYTIIISISAVIGFIKFFKKQKIINYYFLSLLTFLYALSFYFKKSGLSWDIQGRYFLAGFLPLSIFIFYGVLTIIKNNWLTSRLLIFFSLIHYYFVLFFVLILGYFRLDIISLQLDAFQIGYGKLFYFALAGHILLVCQLIKTISLEKFNLIFFKFKNEKKTIF